jgi:cytochrome P450
MSALDPRKKAERSRNLAPGYMLSNLLKSEDAISRTIEMLLDWMDEYAEKHESMHLDRFFTYTAFDVVGEVIFSKKFGFLQQGADIRNAISNSRKLNAFASVLGFFTPWNRIIANPFVTWLQITPMGHLYDITMKAVKEREQNQDARFDVVAHWFRMLAQHPERMQLRDIHAQAINSVSAGADTVSCGLQSFTYHMLRHPSAWRRVRAEIDAACRDRGLCADRVVAFDHAQQLPYLQACIKEALRVFGPVPMGLPRVAPKGGLTIGDRTFPAGTILSVNPWVMHYSKEIWGRDAHEFNPDRWLSDSAAALEKYWIPVRRMFPSEKTKKRKKEKLILLSIPFSPPCSLVQDTPRAPARILLRSSSPKSWPPLSGTTISGRSTRTRTGNTKPTSPSYPNPGLATLRSDEVRFPTARLGANFDCYFCCSTFVWKFEGLASLYHFASHLCKEIIYYVYG